MAALLILLLVAFLVGPRTFQAVFCYILGYLHILHFPVQILSFILWIVIVYLPAKVLTYFSVLASEAMYSYYRHQPKYSGPDSGYPEFESDLSSGL
ncbi:small hydrophobic protein [Wufeng Rhinolophus pearsonii tupavirus 1]|uniref:Small hydrophobic protein n=1 Tax=Wufeng Rhinolophus pearsonii tupavirus 1 TaxID=2877511 RepID=A0AAX2ZD70_9RHAB|nr:small hydrophobic protein [Wufeng Rhinolophus pearsonii tupavirus 1]UBB42390.1 small hydrophobic protein [Wufeng Rhinolophus pearsonii tupavirus 1]WPV62763.1 MAG: small hydrophobic protein [Wufeng bat tupavirus 1]